MKSIFVSWRLFDNIDSIFVRRRSTAVLSIELLMRKS